MSTKNIFCLIVILLAGIFIISCNNIQEIEKVNFPTSIEELEKYYGKNLVSYTIINDNKVFVKFIDEVDIHFNIVNFKEKKIYILPILEDTVIFKSAVNEDKLIFEVSGGNRINSYEVFPYLVHANKEDGEYKLSKEDKWSQVGENMEAKSSDKGVISDLIVESNRLKIVFSAYEDEESDFYAAYADIPSVSVKFMGNNMIIELRESKILKDLDLSILDNISKTYVKDIDFEEYEDHVIISINLADMTKEYLLFKNLPDESDLPFLGLQFR